ncbi:MAG: S9 family peptidase [Parcubacteria group bacterium]|jgi:protease II|nr:S9 family peptidase [Parcubacteria group bacterium]
MSNEKEKWMQRFYDPTIFCINPARSTPHKTIMVSNISGKFQLHSYDFITGFSRQITNKPQGALFGSISPDGKFIYYLNDGHGSEHGHFVRVPFVGGRAIDITPSLPLYYSYEVSVNNACNLLCFHASIEDKNKVYIVPFDTKGKPLSPYLLYESNKSIQGSIMSPDGKFTCISLLSGKSITSSDILVFDNTTRKIAYSFHNIKGSFFPYAFSEYSSKLKVLGLSNGSGFYRPILFNLKEKTSKEINNSALKGDVFVLGWIEKERKMLISDVHQAQQSLFLYDLEKNIVKKIGPTTGTFDLFFNSVAVLPDSSLLIKWHSFESPPKILKLKSPSYKKIIDVYTPVPTTKSKYIHKNVKFRSSDGKEVQMWIVQPKKKKKRPFVIDIHGGPHGFVGDEFSPKTQAWLDKGFGYCAVNYRGSIGFGKEFMEGIYGNPGTWEVEDVVAARNWLVKKGLADSKKIILSGWSWGGYIVLLALGKYPNLWAGGIAGTPIADCVLQYEDEPAYFQAIDRKRFGGTPAQKPKIYKNSSPTTYAKNFQAPVLILYGENDVRCPPRQIKHFEKILRKANKRIIVNKFSSGHAGEFANTKIRIANTKKALDFAVNTIKEAST